MTFGGRFNAVIIGVGGFGGELADDAAKASKIFNVYGGFDTTMQFMSDFKHHHPQVRLYSKYEDVLADTSADGVVIATPNDTHRDLAVKAAEAGKHIFVEKPIANTIADARVIIAAAKKAGVTLYVGHVMRHAAAARTAKRLLDVGQIGKVVWVEGHLAHRGGMELIPQQWRWYRDRCPGGPLMQLSVHTVDTLQYLVGPVKSVSAKVARLATPAEIDDTAVLAVEYESGALGYIGTAYTVPASEFTKIHGTEGSIYFDGKSSNVILTRRDNDWASIPPAAPVVPRADELDDYAMCAMSGSKPETGGEEGVAALAVILAALKSSEKGCSVNVADILAE